jgi:hypothetical protein
LAIFGKVDVEFESKPIFDRVLEGFETVFRVRIIMQATMRNRTHVFGAELSLFSFHIHKLYALSVSIIACLFSFFFKEECSSGMIFRVRAL